MRLVKRTWTHIVEVPADSDAEAIGDPSLEDRFMEAYTQGDGEALDEIVEEDE